MISEIVPEDTVGQLVDWLHETDIFRDIIVGVAVAVSVAVLAFIFRNTIATLIKKLLPRIESKTPHVNFEVKDSRNDSGEWESVVTISNAGNEPAYNVFVFNFEQFPEGNFRISASGMENTVTRSVLGINDSLDFHATGVRFQGCNVTCAQEFWVEYENSLGVAFRVVSEPGSPRGDVARIHPPKVIRRRLEQLPGASKEGGKRELKKYRRGKGTMLPEYGRLSILKWHLANKINTMKPLRARRDGS